MQPSSTSPPTKAAKAGASSSSSQDFRCSGYPNGPAGWAAWKTAQQPPAAAAAAAQGLVQNLAGVFAQQQQAAAAPPRVPRGWWRALKWQQLNHPEVPRRAAARAAAGSLVKLVASAQRYSRKHEAAVQERQRLGLPAPQTGVGPADTRGAQANIPLYMRRYWEGESMHQLRAGGARQMCFPAQVRTQRSSAAAPR